MTFPEISPYVPLLGPYTIGGFGPIGLRWYALSYIVGILLGWRYAVALVRNEKLWGPRGPVATPAQIDDLVLWITFGVIVGGRLGSVIFYGTGREPGASIWEVFAIWKGGMSFHGGLIGVATAIAGFAWFNKDVAADAADRARASLKAWGEAAMRLGDLVAPCAPIGLFFGRIANFINAELWGRVTHGPLGMVFCNHTIMENSGGTCPAGLEPRYPSQLFEAGLEGAALFLILRLATHRLKWLDKPGALIGTFLTFYGLFRILLENVRQPDEGLDHLPLGLTMGMILSVPMVLLGLFLVWNAVLRPRTAAAHG